MRLERVGPSAGGKAEARSGISLVDRNGDRMQEAPRHAQEGGEVPPCIDDGDVDLEIRVLGPAHRRRYRGGGRFPMHDILRSSDLHQVNTDRKRSLNLRSW